MEISHAKKTQINYETDYTDNQQSVTKFIRFLFLLMTGHNPLHRKAMNTIVRV